MVVAPIQRDPWWRLIEVPGVNTRRCRDRAGTTQNLLTGVKSRGLEYFTNLRIEGRF